MLEEALDPGPELAEIEHNRQIASWRLVKIYGRRRQAGALTCRAGYGNPEHRHP